MNALLQSEFCGWLCLALGHSLWQAGAVAIFVSTIARAMRRRSASVRYNVYLAGLLVSLAAFPVTFAVLRAPTAPVAVAIAEPSADRSTQTKPTVATSVPLSLSPTVEQPAVASTSLPATGHSPLAIPALPRFTPWIVAAYLLGVCAMAARLAVGMWSAGALSRRAAVARGDLVVRLQTIAQRWKLRVVPRLAVSAEVVVPKVVGILRPVILLPLSATTGLAPDQLDMILAHELAHVRRHDLWVNLLQRVAETLLFFNPAIWYLSRRLTTLREFACDELVCTGLDGTAAPTARYAAALVRVAELSRPRAAAEIAALAATGKGPSELRRRVARLVGEPLREPVRLTPGGLVVMAAVAVAVLLAPTAWPTRAQQPKADAADQKETAKSNENAVRTLRSGGRVELVAIGTHREKPQRWWQADGTPLAHVPFRVVGDKVFPNEDAVARKVVFRLHDVPEDATVRWEIKPQNGAAESEVILDRDKEPGAYYSDVFLVPKDHATFQLRVGVAADKWQRLTASRSTTATGAAVTEVQGIVFSEAFAKEEATIAIVSQNVENENTRIRVIAVDLAGSEHEGRRTSTVSAAGTVNQTTWSFPDLLPSSIDQFVFQTRPVLWEVFDDMPVKPHDGEQAVGDAKETELGNGKSSADDQSDPATTAPAAEADPLKVPHNKPETISPKPDPLDEQLDEALKADPKANMLRQEIMTREYWIMQLQSVSKRGSSAQIKAYEHEKTAMEEQLAKYREQLKAQLQKELSPFWVYGRVTDGDGKPIEGAKVRAATGIGTLKTGGEATTDADGRYKLFFRAGMMLLEDYAALNVGLQAAIITAHKPGWYETNLNRRGDLQMSDQTPEDLMKEEGWGLESTDSVVFPNQPREVNFTLAPAAVIEGELVGDGTWEIENQSLSLNGDELPPASSAFASATTNKDGKFQMDAVPPGKPWRFEMRIKGTRGEVVSEPFTVPEPGVYRCRVSLDTEAHDDGSVVLKLRQEAVKTP